MSSSDQPKGAKQVVQASKPAGEREEIPISVSATQHELSTDKQETRGSYTGVEPLADDQRRIELGQKDKYPLRAGSYDAPDTLSNEEKETRAQGWAGESDGSGERREMKTQPGSTGQWQDSGIPFSSLAPEKITGSHCTQRITYLCTSNAEFKTLLSHITVPPHYTYKCARASHPIRSHPYYVHTHTTASETMSASLTDSSRTKEDYMHTLTHTRTHINTRIIVLADEQGRLIWRRESSTTKHSSVRVSDNQLPQQTER